MKNNLASSLMVTQSALFSGEVAVVHSFGTSLYLPLYGCLRGAGGILTAILSARSSAVFRTEQLPLQLFRGSLAVGYNWLVVYTFGQLPLGDAAAIAATQIVFIALMSKMLLGEQIGLNKFLAIIVGMAGAMLIIRPGFDDLRVVYLVAMIGPCLNALSFVLNRYSTRKDTASTTMFYTSLASFLANVPLCFMFASLPSMVEIPWLVCFLILGPLGVYAGIVAAKYAETSSLAPWVMLRLVFGVAGGAVVFFEMPDILTLSGIVLILTSCAIPSVYPGTPARRSTPGLCSIRSSRGVSSPTGGSGRPQ